MPNDPLALLLLSVAAVSAVLLCINLVLIHRLSLTEGLIAERHADRALKVVTRATIVFTVALVVLGTAVAAWRMSQS